MSLQDEIKKLATAVLFDMKTAQTAADTVVANPLIAPFIPLIEQAVTNILTAYGVPAANIEQIGEQLFSGVMALLNDAADAAGTPAGNAP